MAISSSQLPFFALLPFTATLLNPSYLLTSISCQTEDISVSCSYIPTPKIWNLRFLFKSVFNCHSQSSLTGLPTTSTLTWVTQKSIDSTVESVCFLFFFSFSSPPPSPDIYFHRFLTSTLHITLHRFLFPLLLLVNFFSSFQSIYLSSFLSICVRFSFISFANFLSSLFLSDYCFFLISF